jgi:hypothetical protein
MLFPDAIEPEAVGDALAGRLYRVTKRVGKYADGASGTPSHRDVTAPNWLGVAPADEADPLSTAGTTTPVTTETPINVLRQMLLRGRFIASSP